jgi:hypothetical protein
MALDEAYMIGIILKSDNESLQKFIKLPDKLKALSIPCPDMNTVSGLADLAKQELDRRNSCTEEPHERATDP